MSSLVLLKEKSIFIDNYLFLFSDIRAFVIKYQRIELFLQIFALWTFTHPNHHSRCIVCHAAQGKTGNRHRQKVCFFLKIFSKKHFFTDAWLISLSLPHICSLISFLLCSLAIMKAKK